MGCGAWFTRTKTLPPSPRAVRVSCIVQDLCHAWGLALVALGGVMDWCQVFNLVTTKMSKEARQLHLCSGGAPEDDLTKARGQQPRLLHRTRSGESGITMQLIGEKSHTSSR